MTDLQTLYEYRKKQSDETLSDAQKMLDQNISPRSVINRAYYAIFYSILSLFLKSETSLKTSKCSNAAKTLSLEFIILTSCSINNKNFNFHFFFKYRQWNTC